MRATHAVLFVLAAIVILAGGPDAAEPRQTLNYQGVLRGADDRPLDGTFDMIFVFYDGADAALEIMLDDHSVELTGGVVVTGGLFNTQIGGGWLFDGAGPGYYLSLSDVFRDFGSVYLEIWVNNEPLSPRTLINAAAYAGNAHALDGLEGAEYARTVHTHSGSQITGPVSDSDLLDGRHAAGFLDTSTNEQTRRGRLNLDGSLLADSIPLVTTGQQSGGLFQNTAYDWAELAGEGWGIMAQGSTVGGYFADRDGSGIAYAGHGNIGISAHGSQSGGYFADRDGSGYAYVGSGDLGIEARGSRTGGYFQDYDNSGNAYVGYGDLGIDARGTGAGGYFQDSDNTGMAWLGYDTYGLSAHGTTAGGYFQDDDGTGAVWAADGDRGLWATGTFAGGTFSHPDYTTFWADVSTPTHKIKGTGTVSFVQNDPDRDDQVIVYAAPEGDEVAVYTRGKARLTGGEARIALGDTFRRVANPDVGLTAYVTPAGEWSDLYVASVSTEELVVRARPESPDVTFHYIVWGLRLGFEELAIVQPKDREAFLPTPEAIASSYGSRPELRVGNALERHRAMSLAVGEGEPDLGRTRQLVATLEGQRARALAGAAADGPAAPPAPAAVAPTPPPERPDRLGVAAVVEPPLEQPRPAPTNLFPVSGEVEEGDVLAFDPAQPGRLHRAASAFDPTVVGVAVGAVIEDGDLRVPVAGSDFVLVKADAAPGAIVPGDLLVSSPLPGHAMRATAPVPGTVLGKAMEPLEAGTGRIRILVLPR